MWVQFRDNPSQELLLPLEDLAYLIIDTQEATLSAPLIARLAEAGCLVIGVDAKHLPSWTSLPWHSFHKMGEILKLQLEATEPIKKNSGSGLYNLKSLTKPTPYKPFSAPKLTPYYNTPKPYVQAIAKILKLEPPPYTGQIYL
jgi:hypothetical protein